MIDLEAINNYILQQAIEMLELMLQWALKAYADIYNQWRIWVNNRPGSHWSHDIKRFTEVDIWCSQFNQV
jgi:hypothetical protein